MSALWVAVALFVVLFPFLIVTLILYLAFQLASERDMKTMYKNLFEATSLERDRLQREALELQLRQMGLSLEEKEN